MEWDGGGGGSQESRGERERERKRVTIKKENMKHTPASAVYQDTITRLKLQPGCTIYCPQAPSNPFYICKNRAFASLLLKCFFVMTLFFSPYAKLQKITDKISQKFHIKSHDYLMSQKFLQHCTTYITSLIISVMASLAIPKQFMKGRNANRQ